MTSVLPPPPLPSLPVLDYSNMVTQVNGHAQNESPERKSRSGHSDSSGEPLSMHQVNGDRSHFPAPKRSSTAAEPTGSSDRRASAAVGLAQELAKKNGASRPSRGKPLRANTDSDVKRRSISASIETVEENWEMRHGWEDQYNSSEYLNVLSNVGSVHSWPWDSANMGIPGLLHVLHRQAP